jgi:hypothetical protein
VLNVADLLNLLKVMLLMLLMPSKFSILIVTASFYRSVSSAEIAGMSLVITYCSKW